MSEYETTTITTTSDLLWEGLTGLFPEVALRSVDPIQQVRTEYDECADCYAYYANAAVAKVMYSRYWSCDLPFGWGTRAARGSPETRQWWGGCSWGSFGCTSTGSPPECPEMWTGRVLPWSMRSNDKHDSNTLNLCYTWIKMCDYIWIRNYCNGYIWFALRMVHWVVSGSCGMRQEQMVYNGACSVSCSP